MTGHGSDTLSNIENATGSSHNDTFVSSSGNNLFDGRSGTDTLSYAAASSGVTVDLHAGTATGDGNDTITNVENVTGSSHTIPSAAPAGTIRSMAAPARTPSPMPPPQAP